MSNGRVFVLLGQDPDTGAASAVAGVLGVRPGGAYELSWVPYQERDGGWRERMAATADIPSALEHWLELADGISWDLLEVADPATPDLRGDVEAILDELLALGAG